MGLTEGNYRAAVKIGAELDKPTVLALEKELDDKGMSGALVKKQSKAGVLWKIQIGSARRPEVLMEKISELGQEVAAILSRSTLAEGETIAISLCQEIDDLDDSSQKGIFLSPSVVQWAASVGASFDIDQYLYFD